MKKILIIGAGATGLAISRVLSEQKMSAEVVVVSSNSVNDVKDEVERQNPFKEESIKITRNLYSDDPLIDVDLSDLRNSHPFSKFIGKGKKSRGRW